MTPTEICMTGAIQAVKCSTISARDRSFFTLDLFVAVPAAIQVLRAAQRTVGIDGVAYGLLRHAIDSLVSEFAADNTALVMMLRWP